MKKTLWFVEVVRYADEEVVKRIECGESERKADKVDDGVNINLDHEHYFTRVVSETK